MAATCIVSSGGGGFNCSRQYSSSNTSLSLPSSSSSSLSTTSCKMQRTNRYIHNSSQHKRQVKKVSPELLPSYKNVQPSADGDPDMEKSSVDRISTMNDEPSCDEAADSDDTIDEEPNSLPLLSKSEDLV